MDTEEMFRRGAEDAERGEVHPFYYQHYYHYRRGYDQMRRRLRRPIPWKQGGRRRAFLLTLLVLLVGSAAVFYVQQQRPHLETLAQGLEDATATPTPTPTRQPIFPTATPEPTPEPPALTAERIALVRIENTRLNGRQEPGLQSPVVASFNPGDQVRILEGPVEADGFTWWRIEGPGGTGWSAERSPDGTIWLEPLD